MAAVAAVAEEEEEEVEEEEEEEEEEQEEEQEEAAGQVRAAPSEAWVVASAWPACLRPCPELWRRAELAAAAAVVVAAAAAGAAVAAAWRQLALQAEAAPLGLQRQRCRMQTCMTSRLPSTIHVRGLAQRASATASCSSCGLRAAPARVLRGAAVWVRRRRPGQREVAMWGPASVGVGRRRAAAGGAVRREMTAAWALWRLWTGRCQAPHWKACLCALPGGRVRWWRRRRGRERDGDGDWRGLLLVVELRLLCGGCGA